MRKRAALYAMCAVLSLALAGVALADNHAIKLSEKDGVGKYFTDSKGMTLYVFKKDSPGKSVCAGPCVVKWPLYFREMVAVPEGLNAMDFGAITREDGKRQTTYKGGPPVLLRGRQGAGGYLRSGTRKRLVCGEAVKEQIPVLKKNRFVSPSWPGATRGFFLRAAG